MGGATANVSNGSYNPGVTAVIGGTTLAAELTRASKLTLLGMGTQILGDSISGSRETGTLPSRRVVDLDTEFLDPCKSTKLHSSLLYYV